MSFRYESLSEKKRTVIVDTDIGPDCDDAAALAVMFELKKKYDFNIGGIINCTSNEYGNGAIDAICEFYGYEMEKTGIYKKADFLSEHCVYNKYLAEKMVKKRSHVIESTRYYNEVLSKCEDNSVVIVTIGQFNAIADALRCNFDLFEKKVYAVISMAGSFPSGKEYNVTEDVASCKYFVENCPCCIIFSGFEVGNSIITGFDGASGENNPVKKANSLWTEGEMKRPSWDLTAMQYAIEGENNFYSLSEEGIFKVSGDGKNTFSHLEGAKRYFLKISSRSGDIEKYLNNLLLKGDKDE